MAKKIVTSLIVCLLACELHTELHSLLYLFFELKVDWRAEHTAAAASSSLISYSALSVAAADNLQTLNLLL